MRERFWIMERDGAFREYIYSSSCGHPHFRTGGGRMSLATLLPMPLFPADQCHLSSDIRPPALGDFPLAAASSRLRTSRLNELTAHPNRCFFPFPLSMVVGPCRDVDLNRGLPRNGIGVSTNSADRRLSPAWVDGLASAQSPGKLRNCTSSFGMRF